MKILKIGLKNLNSLRIEKEIDFEAAPLSESGLFAITGVTGAGKSTILDAITLALYGRIPRNKNVKEIISYGTADCFAEVTFSMKRVRYFAKWNIWRARGKSDGNLLGPNMELSRWNDQTGKFEIIAEKIRDVTQKVEDITGLDYDRFCRSVLLSQGDFAAFLKADDKDRSDLLERITGTEIYSQLSKGAYQRKKQEEEKLTLLKTQIEALQLLSKEELRAIKSALKDLQKNKKNLQKEVKETEQKLNLLERIADLEQKELDYSQQLEELTLLKQQKQSRFDQLALHQKALPLSSLLTNYEDQKTEKGELQTQIQGLKDQLPELQEQHLFAKEQAEKAALERKNLQAQLKEKIPVINKVNRLDNKIEEKDNNANSLELKEEQKTGEVTQLQKKQSQLASNLSEHKEKAAELETWINKHSAFSSLTENLPKIQQKAQSYSELALELKDHLKQETALKEQIDQLSSDLKIKTKEKSQLEKQEQELQLSFKKFNPGQATTKTEAVEHIQDTLQKANEQKHLLQNLATLSGEYQSLLNDFNEYEEQLRGLYSQESAIFKEIMNMVENLDRAREEAEYKEHIYHQQQLMANYEQDRTELKEGEPCPLCLSTSHPFHGKEIKPFVNKAKKEFEQAKKLCEKLIQHQKDLLNQQYQIEHQIEQLSGNEMKKVGGQLEKQQAKILEYEERMAQLIPNLSNFKLGSGPIHLINRLLKNLEEETALTKQQLSQLKKINQELDSLEQSVNTLNQTVLKLELDLEQKKEQLKQTQESKQLKTKKLQQLQKELDTLLKPYSSAISKIKTPEKQIKHLEKEKENFAERQENLAKENKQVIVKTKDLENFSSQLEKETALLKELEKELAEEQKQLKELQKERTELFEDKNPDEVRQLLEDQIEAAEDRHLQYQEQVNTFSTRLNTNRTTLKERENLIQRLEKKLDTLKKELQTKLEKQEFSNIQEIREVLLSETEEQEILTLQEKIRKEEIELRNSIKENAKSLEQERLKQTGEEKKEELTAKLNKQKEVLNQNLIDIGKHQEKLDQHQSNKTKSQELLAQLEAQKKEFNRWEKLNNIIGSADGKAFRVFAQGLTLEKLTQLANQHLQQLSGRYIIQKMNTESLGLEIIDTFQANNQRSMNTLSGGESFLVSLALALGLSDMAGRNTRIDSLFIDEGFGTLDEASLDIALSTLENLQESGKTIGIISHVSALKERIGTQIHVRKQGGGTSGISFEG